MSGHSWSDAEIERLREVWPKGRMRKATVESYFPGRTWSSIVQKARTAGLKKPGYTRWTQEDMDSVARLYGSASEAELVQAFPGRTFQSIAKMASEMKVSRDRTKRVAPLEVLRELRRIRRQRGIKVDQLGARFNTYGSTVSAWETGIKVPNLRGFVEWVAALDLEIVLQRKGFVTAQARSMVEVPGAHRRMSGRASTTARRPT